MSSVAPNTIGPLLRSSMPPRTPKPNSPMRVPPVADRTRGG